MIEWCIMEIKLAAVGFTWMNLLKRGIGTYEKKERLSMEIEKLQAKDKEAFIAFCLKHRTKLDESFIRDEDLADFVPDEENPTFIMKKDGNLIAAASLILDDYHRRGRSGRFRIFYSEVNDQKVYSTLLAEVLKTVKEIEKVIIYVPFINKELSENIRSLLFEVDRYVYLMLRELSKAQMIDLPGGYSIKEFQPDRDEEDWCYIRNTAFSQLKGNSTPITPEMVKKQVSGSEYLEGGLLFLMHHDKPVGIIRGAKDDYEGESVMNIGPFAILPEYQGKGLGRQLLRAAINFAEKKNYNKVMLCVNADNESAKELYLKEGFVQVEGVTAYNYHLV